MVILVCLEQLQLQVCFCSGSSNKDQAVRFSASNKQWTPVHRFKQYAAQLLWRKRTLLTRSRTDHDLHAKVTDQNNMKVNDLYRDQRKF